MHDVKLGVLAQDQITGFRGRVTGLVTYITGCNQALLAPKCKEDGSCVDSQWFDIERLDVIDPKSIALRRPRSEEARAVGPDKPAPRR